MPGPQVGETPPSFVLPRSAVKQVNLQDCLDEGNVLVTFLALAFTGGSDWGVEATLRNFDRDFDRFADRDTTILAITGDSLHVNEAYSRWLGGLRFPILADFLPRGAVSRAWDCWADDREHPRNVTILLDRQGRVRWTAHHMQGGMPDNRRLLAAIDLINQGNPA